MLVPEVIPCGRCERTTFKCFYYSGLYICVECAELAIRGIPVNLAPGEKSTTHFRCARCAIGFEKVCTDEEALAEKHLTIGAFPIEKCAVVCAECHKVHMRKVSITN